MKINNTQIKPFTSNGTANVFTSTFAPKSSDQGSTWTLLISIAACFGKSSLDLRAIAQLGSWSFKNSKFEKAQKLGIFISQKINDLKTSSKRHFLENDCQYRLENLVNGKSILKCGIVLSSLAYTLTFSPQTCRGNI